jgi:hypothetical protein
MGVSVPEIAARVVPMLITSSLLAGGNLRATHIHAVDHRNRDAAWSSWAAAEEDL